MLVGWMASCGLFGADEPVDAYIDPISLTSNEHRRTAFLHLPPGGALAGSKPLWIVLHGSTYDDPAKGRAAAARWIDALNDEAIFVFPESGSWADAERPWHGPWGAYQWRDLVFLRDLIEQLAEDHGVDTRRVYLVGHGEGASLVAWAQCADPRRYAGFAMVDGAPPESVRAECTPTIRRPVITLHQDARRLDQPWHEWMLESHDCTEMPIETPTAEGPETSRGQGRRHDCWTVPWIESWTLGPSRDCLPRDEPPCDWVGPQVVEDYFARYRAEP